MSETVELKPCPFCGQSMIEIEGFSNRMQKHMGHPDNGCFLAGSRVIVSRHEFDQERVIAWNTRSDPAVRDRVKPLEWGKTSYGTPEAMSVVGVYRINSAMNGGYTVVFGGLRGRALSGPDGRTNFADEGAAKIAAQADCERRILSALEPLTSPPSPASGWKWALVPDYPEGDVVSSCICGSWPGGNCLKCPPAKEPQ